MITVLRERERGYITFVYSTCSLQKVTLSIIVEMRKVTVSRIS